MQEAAAATSPRRRLTVSLGAGGQQVPGCSHPEALRAHRLLRVAHVVVHVRALQLREGSRQELEVRRGWLTYSLLLCLQWPGSNRGLSLTALTLDGCVSTQTCTLAVGTQKILSSIKSRKGNLGSSRCDDEKPRRTIAPDHFFVVARLGPCANLWRPDTPKKP